MACHKLSCSPFFLLSFPWGECNEVNQTRKQNTFFSALSLCVRGCVCVCFGLFCFGLRTWASVFFIASHCSASPYCGFSPTFPHFPASLEISPWVNALYGTCGVRYCCSCLAFRCFRSRKGLSSWARIPEYFDLWLPHWMNEWMNVWLSEWLNECVTDWMDGQKHEKLAPAYKTANFLASKLYWFYDFIGIKRYSIFAVLISTLNDNES